MNYMGEFPDKVVKEAWKRSGGRCECTRDHEWHKGRRCPQKLNWDDRGKEKQTGWEAHHKISQAAGGSDTLSNCEILCQNCHKGTWTYGKK